MLVPGDLEPLKRLQRSLPWPQSLFLSDDHLAFVVLVEVVELVHKHLVVGVEDRNNCSFCQADRVGQRLNLKNEPIMVKVDGLFAAAQL